MSLRGTYLAPHPCRKRYSVQFLYAHHLARACRVKRVLLVAYVFPPEPSPGALRPAYLTRYLPQYGWEAVVLTHTADEPPFPARVVHARSGLTTLLDRLPFRVRNALLLPDATSGWIPDALRAGLQLLRTEHFDAILGTGQPASVHAICSFLSLQSGLPWLADYRDPWAGNTYMRRGKVRTHLEHAIERGLLRRAKAITTISDAVSTQVAAFLKRRDVQTIPNAYDPTDWEAIPHSTPANFDLVFTGSMYDGKRKPDILFEALARLRERGEPAACARVHFYGPNSEFVSQTARRHGIADCVELHGVVPRTQAMRAQRSAAATMVFLSMESAGAAEMGSKFLEYLGARRPILAFGPRGNAMEAFLAQHDLGWFASDVDGAERALRSAYHHFRSGSADTIAQPQDFPTAPKLAQRFAQRLDALTVRSQSALSEFTLDTARGEFECR